MNSDDRIHELQTEEATLKMRLRKVQAELDGLLAEAERKAEFTGRKPVDKSHPLMVTRAAGTLSGQEKRRLIEQQARKTILANGGVATTAQIEAAISLDRAEYGVIGAVALISSTLSRSDKFVFVKGAGWKLSQL